MAGSLPAAANLPTDSGRVSASSAWIKSAKQTTQPRLTILKFDDLSEVKTFDLPVTIDADLDFSADSRALIYGDKRDGVTNLWRLPLDGSPAKQITDFKADEIGSFAYSRDGKQLAASRGSTTRDALIISDEQK